MKSLSLNELLAVLETPLFDIDPIPNAILENFTTKYKLISDLKKAA